MSIYTRTGDTGETSLFGGKRVLKSEQLVDVYGSLDELNSWVGLISSLVKSRDLRTLLGAIQSDLFLIGSHLAGWQGDDQGQALTGLKGLALEKRVKEMEKRIDAMEGKVGKLHNFILPGGTQLGAFIHLARSICRRVERQTVALFQGQTLINKGLTLSGNKQILIYLNRLSDLFFMLARFINKQAGVEEIAWSGISRQKKKKREG